MLFLVPSIRRGKTDTHRRYLQKGGRKGEEEEKKQKDGGSRGKQIPGGLWQGEGGREEGGQVTRGRCSGLTVCNDTSRTSLTCSPGPGHTLNAPKGGCSPFWPLFQLAESFYSRAIYWLWARAQTTFKTGSKCQRATARRTILQEPAKRTGG